MSDKKILPADVLAARDKLKAKLAERKQAFEAEEADIKARIDRAEKWLSNHLVNVVGADSARFGTKSVARVSDVHIRVNDWAAYHKYLHEQANLTLLQKRVAKNELLKHIEEHGGELPPGLTLEPFYRLQITTVAPKKK